ncbi:uncharacterized protein FFC1_03906 [Fusarium fujikuroi]|nr:uncharacterized protein FFC1_03906 [Fusarium fujikuroi]
MLKQRRSSRQPRTDTRSEGDGEADASPASRDTFPLYRHYQSDLNNSYDTAKQVLEDDLDERLTLEGEPRHGINRSEKDRRISPQVQFYDGVRGPQLQFIEYEDIDLDVFRPPSGRTDNPTRTPSPLRYYSPHSSVQHRAANIFEGRSTVGREKAELDYDVETRNLGQSNLPYKPVQAPPPYRSHTSIEHFKRSWGFGRAQDTAERLVAEGLWKAGYREGPGGRLRAIRSFSKLSSKDTISRDSTIGDEARMDDLLACVGKKMMKTPSLKEPGGDGLNNGEKLGAHTRNGYQSRSQRIDSIFDTDQWQKLSPPPSPPTELGESEDGDQDVERAPSPRPTWADAYRGRPLDKGDP